MGEGARSFWLGALVGGGPLFLLFMFAGSPRATDVNAAAKTLPHGLPYIGGVGMVALAVMPLMGRWTEGKGILTGLLIVILASPLSCSVLFPAAT